MCIVNNCHGAVVGNDQLITRAGDANGGRDRIDHGPRGHDDLVNAVCGVLAMPRPGAFKVGRLVL